MEYSSAEMTCELKVNVQCEACRIKVMEILQNIRGVYAITIDAEQGTVKVSGRVNPNKLLRILEKYGKHAVLKHVKFDGEVKETSNNYGQYAYTPYGMEYPYGPIFGGHAHPPEMTHYFFPPPPHPPAPPLRYPPPPRPPPPPPPGPSGAAAPRPSPPPLAQFPPAPPLSQAPRGLAPFSYHKIDDIRESCIIM
ncbi:heavy metal-associated isoprenylated plant protein 21-like [Quillaja saponaria]|uniref:Heavy metal-associated isoprenylated plant protein 21-like n=1 Tax=Quillaja saponaria TaxID=32244 RepID=A0AAD7LSZ4_QUISA|nr:heavy metal-associated isoprenylated plant protein 21-like [Quillaja saponaria]